MKRALRSLSPPSPELDALAVECLERLLTEHPMRRRPELIWRPLRVAAGRAELFESRIVLSSRLLISEERLIETIVHEYAHLLAFDRHGRKAANHGVFWQAAMRELGAEPTITHRYEVVRQPSKKLVGYQCRKCGLTMERRRRLPSRRQWLHRGCGGEVVLAYERQTLDGRQPA